LWMADDFDEPLDNFKDYMWRYLSLPKMLILISMKQPACFDHSIFLQIKFSSNFH
jgi:hypothetical protein